MTDQVQALIKKLAIVHHIMISFIGFPVYGIILSAQAPGQEGGGGGPRMVDPGPLKIQNP